MPKPEPDEPDLTFSAPDVAAEIVRWLGYLGAEKRMSPKTVEAYQRDVHQFLAFLAEHLGGRPSLAKLAKLTPADVRAFLRGYVQPEHPVMQEVAAAQQAATGWDLARTPRGTDGCSIPT